MLYIHICLSRSRLLPYFMPSVGLCLSVFGATCLCGCIHPFLWYVRCNHLWDISLWCWCAWYTPSSASCDVVMLALLALCHPFSFLCFFVSLHTCLRVHAWVCASLVLHSHWTMDTRSKSTFVLLRHPPFFFYNMLVCPHLASFASLSFSMLSFYLLLFLFVGLFLLLLHVHIWSMDTWSKGVTS